VRVLIATDYYPPFIGGAQFQSRLLARNLRDRGHEVVVVTPSQRGVPKIEEDDEIAVHRLRQVRTVFWGPPHGTQRHHPPFPDPVTIVGLRRLVRRFKPEVVHSYGWISYSCAAALLGTDIPLLLTARDYGYGCANRTLLRDGRACDGPAFLKCVACAGRNYGRPKGWLAALGVFGSRRLLRHKTRALHCVSTYVREIMRRDFIDDRSSTIPSYVIHDVVYSEGADPAAEQEYLEQLPDEPFMLFVGALRRAKGVHELLAAYMLLDGPPPLVLIGTPEPDSPTAFPAGVRVIKGAPHSAVLAAWERSLFAVLPSLLPEPFGTVVVEAMSRGKPVIGTRPGGHLDLIVDGESGLLVPRGDVEALAGAMRALLADRELRDRLGRAALARSARFTASVSLPRLEQALDELATARRDEAAAIKGGPLRRLVRRSSERR
jgi:glycosyltransferase involved in cell wall biosynthesis